MKQDCNVVKIVTEKFNLTLTRQPNPTILEYFTG